MTDEQSRSIRVKAPKIGEKGFRSLINAARKLYRKEVLKGNKSYARFVQDFIHSNTYHDALDAWSKNQHHCNYHRISELLVLHKDMAINYFIKETVDINDLKSLIYQFNQSDGNLTHPPQKRALTFDVSGSVTDKSNTSVQLTPLSQDLIDLIVQFANEVNLFNEPITQRHVDAFYAGQPLKVLTCNNNTYLVLLMDILHEYNLISFNWKSIICQKLVLKNKRSKDFLSERSLYTALSRIKNKESPKAKYVRLMERIHELVKEYKRKQSK